MGQRAYGWWWKQGESVIRGALSMLEARSSLRPERKPEEKARASVRGAQGGEVGSASCLAEVLRVEPGKHSTKKRFVKFLRVFGVPAQKHSTQQRFVQFLRAFGVPAQVYVVDAGSSGSRVYRYTDADWSGEQLIGKAPGGGTLETCAAEGQKSTPLSRICIQLMSNLSHPAVRLSSVSVAILLRPRGHAWG